MWNCERCTYKNDDSKQKCTMCGTARPFSGDKVHCPACTFVNPAGAARCSVCQSSLEGGKPVESGESGLKEPVRPLAPIRDKLIIQLQGKKWPMGDPFIKVQQGKVTIVKTETLKKDIQPQFGALYIDANKLDASQPVTFLLLHRKRFGKTELGHASISVRSLRKMNPNIYYSLKINDEKKTGLQAYVCRLLTKQETKEYGKRLNEFRKKRELYRKKVKELKLSKERKAIGLSGDSSAGPAAGPSPGPPSKPQPKLKDDGTKSSSSAASATSKAKNVQKKRSLPPTPPDDYIVLHKAGIIWRKTPDMADKVAGKLAPRGLVVRGRKTGEWLQDEATGLWLPISTRGHTVIGLKKRKKKKKTKSKNTTAGPTTQGAPATSKGAKGTDFEFDFGNDPFGADDAKAAGGGQSNNASASVATSGQDDAGFDMGDDPFADDTTAVPTGQKPSSGGGDGAPAPADNAFEFGDDDPFGAASGPAAQSSQEQQADGGNVQAHAISGSSIAATTSDIGGPNPFEGDGGFDFDSDPFGGDAVAKVDETKTVEMKSVSVVAEPMMSPDEPVTTDEAAVRVSVTAPGGPPAVPIQAPPLETSGEAREPKQIIGTIKGDQPSPSSLHQIRAPVGVAAQGPPGGAVTVVPAVRPRSGTEETPSNPQDADGEVNVDEAKDSVAGSLQAEKVPSHHRVPSLPHQPPPPRPARLQSVSEDGEDGAAGADKGAIGETSNDDADADTNDDTNAAFQQESKEALPPKVPRLPSQPPPPIAAAPAPAVDGDSAELRARVAELEAALDSKANEVTGLTTQLAQAIEREQQQAEASRNAQQQAMAAATAEHQVALARAKQSAEDAWRQAAQEAAASEKKLVKQRDDALSEAKEAKAAAEQANAATEQAKSDAERAKARADALEKERSAAVAAVAETKASLASLQAQTGKEKSVDEHAADIDLLKRTLQAGHAMVVQDLKQAHQSRVNGLEEKLEAAQAAVDMTRGNLERAVSDADDHKREAETLRQSVERGNEAAQLSISRARALEAEASRLRTTVDDKDRACRQLEQEVSGLRESQATAAAAAKEAEARANDAETRAKAAGARAKEAEESAAQAEARAQKAEEDAKKAITSAQEAKSRAEKAEERAQELERSATESKESASGLEGAKAAIEAEAERLRSSVAELKAALESQKIAEKSAQDTVAQLSNQVSQLQAKLRDAEAAAQTSREALAKATADGADAVAAATGAQAEAFRGEKAKMAQRFEQMRAARESEKKKHDDEIATLKLMQSKALADGDDSRESLRQEVRRLETELKEAQLEIQDLKDSATGDVELMQHQKEDAEAEAADAREAARVAVAAQRRAEAEMVRLRADLDTARVAAANGATSTVATSTSTIPVLATVQPVPAPVAAATTAVLPNVPLDTKHSTASGAAGAAGVSAKDVEMSLDTYLSAFRALCNAGMSLSLALAAIRNVPSLSPAMAPSIVTFGQLHNAMLRQRLPMLDREMKKVQGAAPASVAAAAVQLVRNEALFFVSLSPMFKTLLGAFRTPARGEPGDVSKEQESKLFSQLEPPLATAILGYSTKLKAFLQASSDSSRLALRAVAESPGPTGGKPGMALSVSVHEKLLTKHYPMMAGMLSKMELRAPKSSGDSTFIGQWNSLAVKIMQVEAQFFLALSKPFTQVIKQLS